jgi:hypothetical protein
MTRTEDIHVSHRLSRSSAIASTAILLLGLAGCGSATGTASPSGPAQAAVSLAPTPSSGSTLTPTSSPTPSVAPTPRPTPDLSGPIDPAKFTATIDNPWLPFVPGTVFTYTGTKDGEAAVDVVTVTARTAVIDGVTCVLIEDRLKLRDVLEEETVDYYTQDVFGNVWYFGEDTKELDAKGRVTSREGTWHAGVDGAVPGVFMEAEPTIGNDYAQEFYKGHAEDHFRVKSLTASVTVPAGSYTGVLLTEEWTPLEPDVLDNKYYVKGIGEVREVAVKGPREELRLVKVDRP